MTMTLLTCISCGKKLLVRDQPDGIHLRNCTCSQPMLSKHKA